MPDPARFPESASGVLGFGMERPPQRSPHGGSSKVLSRRPAAVVNR